MRVLHFLDFWECVPRNLASGVAPLRAYRKITQVRLKFRAIRSPEAPRKSFQPEEGQISVLVSGWIFGCIFRLLSGTNRPSGFMNPPERIQKFSDGRHVDGGTPLDQFGAVLSREIRTEHRKPISLFLTLNFIFSLRFLHLGLGFGFFSLSISSSSSPFNKVQEGKVLEIHWSLVIY